MNDLEKTAVLAVHNAAIDYCDGLVTAGKTQLEGALEAMSVLIGEAALIAHATRTSPEKFLEFAEAVYRNAELVARKVAAES